MALARTVRLALTKLAFAVALAGAGAAPAADSLAEAFAEGEASASFRYRFEFVDQDNFDENAEASTLLGRVNYRTGDWNGFAAFGELDLVGNVGWDNYDEGGGNTPDRSQYPVVADPTGGDFNQAWLQWSDGGGLTLRGGRQRIIYDNARFIGAVGWRQNEQTFDGVWAQKKTPAGLDLQLAWVWQVNRIFGDDVPAGRNDGSTWLANAGWEIEGAGRLVGYYYDIDNDDVASFSTRTWGVRFSGQSDRGGFGLGYAVDYAHQADAHDNTVDFSADYLRLDLSVTVAGITPFLARESLGGHAGRAGAAFRTPLATLHGFNGWTDQFLTTPDAGLVDLFGGLRGKAGPWAWDVTWHDFEAESGSMGFGQEINASISRPFLERYSVLFKAGRFDADAGSPYPDTTKFWLQLTADF